MRRVTRSDPNLVLAVAAAAVVSLEAVYRQWTSTVWLVLALVVAGAALVHAWREQHRLRLVPVLVVVAALQLALLGVHLALDAVADKDSSVVFRWQGNALLRGDYPRSEYPVGAVSLFALEAWVGGGSTRAANALLMIPFALVAIAAVWLTRLPHAAWLATLIGLWPANAYYWQYKYDLAPAALLVLGLLLALRGRWTLAGVVLGAGALVKWTPALAALALVAWLLGSRRLREAASHAGAFAATVAIVYLPFLLWSASEVAAAYTRQSGRSITPESLWYLLLRPFDLARVRTHISFAAGAPEWADVGATIAQAALVIVVLALAARAAAARGAVALAALAPGVFLLTNRIFSPQFVVVTFAAWGFAAALVVRSRREQLAVGAAMAAAAAANQFVFPYALPWYDVTWVAASVVLFGVGIALTAALAARAARLRSMPA